MVTTVQKWGNSLAVRIPRSVAADVRLQAGKAVDLTVEDGRIVVAPARGRKYTLKGLLKGVTARNRHGEVESGAPVGREAF